MTSERASSHIGAQNQIIVKHNNNKNEVLSSVNEELKTTQDAYNEELKLLKIECKKARSGDQNQKDND